MTVVGYQVTLLAKQCCRAERKKDQVCSQQEYKAVFARLAALPRTVEHMVLQTGGSPWLRPLTLANVPTYIGIPVAYPRMVFLESALDSKLNPLVALGRSGSLGLSGFVNKFNADAELLDDLVSRPIVLISALTHC